MLSGLTRTQRLDLNRVQPGVNSKEKTPSIPLFKDNDLQNRINLKLEAAMALSLQIREDIMFLRSELGFLFKLLSSYIKIWCACVECEVTDYSLLIGVRRRKFGVVDNRETNNPAQFFQQQQPLSNNGSNNNTRAPSVDDKGAVAKKSSKINPFQRDTDGGMHAGLVEGPGTYYFGIVDILEQWTWRKHWERMFKVYFRCFDPDGISCMPPLPYADRFWRRAVRDVFEYVEQGVDEDLDAPPRFNMNFSPSASVGRLRSSSANNGNSVDSNSLSPNAPLSRKSLQQLRVPSVNSSDNPNGASRFAKPNSNGADVTNNGTFAIDEEREGSDVTAENDGMKDIQIQQRETDRRFSLIPMNRPSNFAAANRASMISSGTGVGVSVNGVGSNNNSSGATSVYSPFRASQFADQQSGALSSIQQQQQQQQDSEESKSDAVDLQRSTFAGDGERSTMKSTELGTASMMSRNTEDTVSSGDSHFLSVSTAASGVSPR
jgi:hypothetical protein